MNNIINFNTDKVLLFDIDSHTGFHEHIRCSSLAIIICMQGEGEVEINYSKHKIRKNGVLVIFPLDIVSYISSSADMLCRVLLLPSNTFTPILDDIKIAQFEYIRCVPVQYPSDEYVEFMKTTFSLLEKAHALLDYESFERVTEKQVASMFYVQQSYCVGNKDNTRAACCEYMSRKRELFRKFIKKLVNSHSISREVLFYANEMGISSGYLNEICNEVSGHSAKDIIDSAVAARLKYELSCTSKSIQELSDEYNFPSQSYFSRYFRRMAGVTPSEFRRNHGNV
jgi:AraC-like DNA-binding protein